MSSGWFDCTEPSLTTSLQGKQGVQCARALVLGGSSASNIFEPHHRRDSKVCRVLPQAFGVVRLYRTFSNYIFIGETRFAGCLCTSSGWFKRIEHLSRGNKVCTVAYALVRGGSTVPNLLYLNLYRGNKVCSVLMHYFGVVQAHRTSSNLLKPHHRRDRKVCRVLPHEFRVYRTFSTYIYTGETRFAGCLCTWFKRIEPPRTSSNHIMTEIAGRVEFIH